MDRHLEDQMISPFLILGLWMLDTNSERLDKLMRLDYNEVRVSCQPRRDGGGGN